jgi:hypothetical protein
MKRLALVMLAVSAIAFAADVKDVNRTVALSANGSVEIETHKGTIQVTVWDRQEVEIKARIQAEPGTTMDQRRFDGTEVRIESSPNSVQIRTYYPDFAWCCSFDDNGNNPEVRYTIRMPKMAKLKIHDHRTETEVSGVQGGLDLTTHRGSAHIHGLSGPLHVDTHRGDIHVDFSLFTEASSIVSYRGTVELSMPKTSRFSIESNAGRRGSIFTDFSVMTTTFARRAGGVHGAVNGGGPLLRLETERGEIQIHGK